MRRTRSVRVPVPQEAPAVPPGRAAAAPDVATCLAELHQTGGNQMVVRLLASARSAQAADGGDLAGRVRARLGRGEPLSDNLRTQAQAGLGQPLGDVRLHRDTEAAALAGNLGARAFTAGQDVFFGDGEYDPASPSGFGVLAHELAHTVQQDAGVVAGQPHGSGLVVSEPGDRDELAAEAAARGATAPLGRSAGSAGGPGLAIQRDAATALPLSDVARSRSEQIRASASVRLLKVAGYNAAA